MYRQKGVLDTILMGTTKGKFTSEIWAKKTSKYIKQAQKLTNKDWKAILNSAYAYMYTPNNMTNSDSDSTSSSSDTDHDKSDMDMDVDPDWDDTNEEAWRF